MGDAPAGAICRPLSLSDFADLCALYAELSVRIPALTGDAGAARFQDILDHPGTAVFGAELDGRIVSMATLHVLPNLTYAGRSYALVENVATLSDYRRQGLARLVMTTLEQAAWSRDCYKIMLLTGRHNVAKGFYERLGYRSDEKHGLVLRRALPN
ncbi:MAG: GNAT family N-acetyltransferase [Pseudomonadota bacterium]